jgi:hypothetical protein
MLIYYGMSPSGKAGMRSNNWYAEALDDVEIEYLNRFEIDSRIRWNSIRISSKIAVSTEVATKKSGQWCVGAV